MVAMGASNFFHYITATFKQSLYLGRHPYSSSHGRRRYDFIMKTHIPLPITSTCGKIRWKYENNLNFCRSFKPQPPPPIVILKCLPGKMSMDVLPLRSKLEIVNLILGEIFYLLNTHSFVESVSFKLDELLWFLGDTV